MKKILSFIFVFIAVLTLAACAPKETPEEVNEKQFKDYLQANDALTVEEFDAMFAESEFPELPADLFTNINVENLFIETYGDTNSDYYIWQNASKVYFAPTIIDTTVDNGPYYVDLAELEAAYDEAMKESATSSLKPSEMIDAILAEMMASPEAQVTLNLETLLGAFTFKFEDFERVELGKYALKNSVLFDKIAKLSGGMITAADLEAQIASSGYSLNFYTYFDGSRINGFEFKLSMSQGGISMSMGIKLMLLFNNEQFNGISLEANIPGSGEIKLSIKVEDEKLKLDAMITGYDYTDEGMPMQITISANITISKDNITVSITQGNNELLYANLNLVLAQKEGKYTFGLNGNFRFAFDTEQTGMVTITSGSSVTIPSEVKALETTAENLLNKFNVNDDLVVPAQ